jgi:hypothetical protein
MLAIHWTTVQHTKHILKNGITKSKNGLYCFPLTGHPSIDKWWVHFFNQCAGRHKKSYHGIIFRIAEDDLPAYFGHWIGATTTDTFTKPIQTLSALGEQYRKNLLWRIGESIAMSSGMQEKGNPESYLDIGEKALSEKDGVLTNYFNDRDFMQYTLEDYQIVLSHSIPAKRIIRVIPQGNDFAKRLIMLKFDRHKNAFD